MNRKLKGIGLFLWGAGMAMLQLIGKFPYNWITAVILWALFMLTAISFFSAKPKSN
jgi:hypothetical protein